MPLTTDGRLMDNTSFAPAAARVAASVGSSSGGKGWLAAVEAAAAALPGDDANSDDDDTADDSIIEGDFTGEAADDSTPLGDAQPFDYTPDSLGDAEQDAGVFLTPAEEMECETQYEADMAECSAYAAMDRSSWGMCKERAMNRYASCLRGMG
jgi:hypothetical protein